LQRIFISGIHHLPICSRMLKSGFLCLAGPVVQDVSKHYCNVAVCIVEDFKLLMRVQWWVL